VIWGRFPATGTFPLLAITISLGCKGIDLGEKDFFSGEAFVVRQTVVRESDNATLYEKCHAVGHDEDAGDFRARFRASPADIVRMTGQSTTVVKRRVGSDNPNLHIPTGDSYWCGPEDDFSTRNFDVSNVRCSRESGQDPPAKVLSVTVDPSPPADMDAFYGGAKSYIFRLEIRHDGILLVEADPACLGRTAPPSPLLEVLP